MPPFEPAADPLRAALEASLGFQYRIEGLLGRGGMGAVYLAHELALDRSVAIKVLPPERQDAADALERFRREARTAARLSHPNIVPLHTFGEVKGLVYFVMGYVRGESLGLRLKRAGRVGVEETRRILAEVADALAYAHAQGVVHRDIKPDNILIESDSERPLLTDFGVAKARSLGNTLTATGQVVGTPGYMSPEQAAGRSDIDGRSDLYSLGVMAYAMLAGRLPFEGKTPGDVLVQHMTREAPALQSAAPHVPQALAAAVMRCLVKDPNGRWQDAKSLREALAPDEFAPEQPGALRIVNFTTQATLGALLMNAYVRVALAGNPDPLSVPGFLQEPWDRIAMVALGGLLVGVIQARRRLKQTWPAVIRAAVAQPSWWPGWYPKALRRPGDLWARLPRPIRAARHAVAAAILAFVMVTIPLSLVLTNSATHHEHTGTRTRLGGMAAGLGPRLPMSLAVVVLGGILAVPFAILWLKRRLGDAADWDELAPLSATWKKSSPWRRPAYRALLRPVEAEGVTVPRSEEDLAREVLRLADALPPEFARVAQQSRAAVRVLRGAIDALDREIASLARDIDPQEAARLAERLNALGPPMPEDPLGRAELRELLTRQLALVEGLAVRLEAAHKDRAGRAELLHVLWLRSSRAAALDERAVADLRALCAEIQSGAPPVGSVANPSPGIDELPTLEH